MKETELYLSGLSIPQISDKLGVPRSTVRSRLIKQGCNLRTRGDGIRSAGLLGRLSGAKGKTRVFTDEWKENIRRGKLLAADINAKGLSKKPSGYIEITRGENKGRRQHVVIMEEFIGRRITRGECVHHKNGIKDDNRLENLQLMTISEHCSHHAKEKINQRIRNKKGMFI